MKPPVNYEDEFKEDDKKSTKHESPEKQAIGMYDEPEEVKSHRSQKSEKKQTPAKEEPEVVP